MKINKDGKGRREGKKKKKLAFFSSSLVFTSSLSLSLFSSLTEEKKKATLYKQFVFV